MHIEIFQDLVCPWCRIGKKNLMDALAQFTSEPVQIEYRAFQLDPTTPVEGEPFKALMRTKFRADDTKLQAMLQQVTQAGQASGLDFDFSRVEMMPNTLKAHQLLAIAPDEIKKQLVDDLFQAYFEDGKDIGLLSTLLDAAERHGMDRSETQSRLEQNDGLADVENDIAFASQVGVSSVPFFIINRKYALTGAQPSSTFLQALQQISAESSTGEA